MKTCDVCGNDYVPRSDVKTKRNYCSHTCRARIASDEKKRKNILSGDYDRYKVGTIRNLGFVVEVREK